MRFYSLVNLIFPQSLINLLRALRVKGVVIREQLSFRKSLNPEKVFSRIYSQGSWGSSIDEALGSSGSGSHLDSIVKPYVDCIYKLSETEGFKGTRFVDLGCGDFNVGKAIFGISSTYIAVDVVDSIIVQNKRNYRSSLVDFRSLNIVDDPLPDGDVCFLRQVLQHCSNEQINKIVRKLWSFKWVFITEHYPSINLFTKSNIDKQTGASIRLVMGSGVYLTDPPFSLNPQSIRQVLEVQDGWKGKFSGSIKTFMYKPGQIIL